jgi:hypothetical protein
MDKRNTKEVDNLKARILAIASTTDLMRNSEGTCQPLINESWTSSGILLFQPPPPDEGLHLVQVYQGATVTGLIDSSNQHSLIEIFDAKRTGYYDQLKGKFDEIVGLVGKS